MAKAKAKPQIGAWCHIEIPTRSLSKAKKFYGKIFGWKFEDMPGSGYSLYETPGGVGGGLSECKDRKAPPMISYILVDDIEKTVQKVTKAGGKLKEAKSEVPGFGSYAVVTDPDGNPVGLWQSAMRQRATQRGRT